MRDACGTAGSLAPRSHQLTLHRPRYVSMLFSFALHMQLPDLAAPTQTLRQVGRERLGHAVKCIGPVNHSILLSTPVPPERLPECSLSLRLGALHKHFDLPAGLNGLRCPPITSSFGRSMKGRPPSPPSSSCRACWYHSSDDLCTYNRACNFRSFRSSFFDQDEAGVPPPNRASNSKIWSLLGSSHS